MTYECNVKKRSDCLLANFNEKCTNITYFALLGDLCAYHYATTLGLVLKRNALPPEYRNMYTGNVNCNRSYTLYAINPKKNYDNDNVVFRKNDIIIPTSEEAQKYFQIFESNDYQHALDSLSVDNKIALEKMRQNFSFLKQLAKCFARDKNTYGLSSLAADYFTNLTNEKNKILDEALKLLPVTVNDDQFPKLSFRLSKPLEYYYRNLVTFDGKCQETRKPWETQKELSRGYLTNENKIQEERLIRFKTFFSLYMTQDSFPSSKVKDTWTEADKIRVEVFDQLNEVYSHHETPAKDLRRYLRIPFLNQYSNETKIFYPLLMEAISGHVCTMLIHLSLPVSDRIVRNEIATFIDKANKHFDVETFQSLAMNEYFKTNSSMLFTCLFNQWHTVNSSENRSNKSTTRVKRKYVPERLNLVDKQASKADDIIESDENIMNQDEEIV